MLDLRSVWIAGKWEAFQKDRIERHRESLYPHRDLVAGEAFFAWHRSGRAVTPSSPGRSIGSSRVTEYCPSGGSHH